MNNGINVNSVNETNTLLEEVIKGQETSLVESNGDEDAKTDDKADDKTDVKAEAKDADTDKDDITEGTGSTSAERGSLRLGLDKAFDALKLSSAMPRLPGDLKKRTKAVMKELKSLGKDSQDTKKYV